MKVFDVVDAFIAGLDDVCTGVTMVDSDKVDILREYCDVIDIILSECGGCKSSVSIEPRTNNISISIEVAVFSANRFNQLYFDLIERSVSLTVFNANNGNVGIKFMFPSVFV